MVEFKIAPHAFRADVKVIEIYKDGRFVGTIAPGLDGEDGLVKVISKYQIAARTFPKDSANLYVVAFAIASSL